MLTGRPGPEPDPWEAATVLGFSPDCDLIVVAAESPALGTESLREVEQRLRTIGVDSAWRLSPSQQLGIVAFEPGTRETVLEVLREVAENRTGVSPSFDTLADAPRALHLAFAVMATCPPGSAAVRVFDESPLAALAVSEPAEGRRLVEHVLGPVLRLPVEDRDLLVSTLNAYVDVAGNTDRAAEALFCHPNTVRNRLRRVQELTGRSLTEPLGTAELTAAAYALRLDRATKLWGGRRRS